MTRLTGDDIRRFTSFSETIDAIIEDFRVHGTPVSLDLLEVQRLAQQLKASDLEADRVAQVHLLQSQERNAGRTLPWPDIPLSDHARDWLRRNP